VCSAVFVALAQVFVVGVTNGLREGGAPKSLVCRTAWALCGGLEHFYFFAPCKGLSTPLYRSRDKNRGYMIGKEREKQKVFKGVQHCNTQNLNFH
jgi:hypothetical protein